MKRSMTNANATKTDVYSIVTDRVIALLEAGTIPWRKTWKGGAAGAPRNLKSGKAYRGVNVFVLAAQAYGSPYWLTFKQAKDMGGSVRKGSKGTPVVFWNWIVKEDPKDKTKKIRIPFLRYYTVFNIEQCEGIVTPADVAPVAGPAEAIDAAEAIVRNMPNAPAIRHGGDAAYYRPSTDAVQMPARESFESAPAYYTTFFHELGHSTGHASRLSRTGVTNPTHFGSHEYSQEELVAEMTATFLSAEAGIEAETIANSAAYLASWMKVLKNDRKLLVMAAAQAQKAADMILGRSAAATEEESDESQKQEAA